MKNLYIMLLLFITTQIHCDTYKGLKYKGPKKTVLIFGAKTGWFGQIMYNILQDLGHNPVKSSCRLENRESILKEIESISPDCVISAAGVTGRPNIDWCEDNKEATIRANIIGALNLADICFLKNVHFTNIGTGCLYDYDEQHPKFSEKAFKETDPANHDTSFYCESKIYLEKLLLRYPVLNLRVRMPVSYDYNPRNFIVKITNYQKVINEPNSLSVLEDLLPIAVDMSLRQIQGNFNFVNPGVITHNEILDLYKKHIDSKFTYINFTVEEQDKILKAARSNCALDTTKLLSEYPHIPHIKDSIRLAILEMAKNKVQP